MKPALYALTLLLSVSTAPMALAATAPEVEPLLAAAARESGRPSYSARTAVKFKDSDNVFVKSALAVDFTPRNASVTCPCIAASGRTAGRPTTSSPRRRTSTPPARWA
jgi:hypothetical protein